MICAECNGKGWGMAGLSGDFADCLTCDGKGKVPDFSFLSVVLPNGGTGYRRSITQTAEGPMRFTLQGARREAQTIRKHGAGFMRGTSKRVDLRPNCVVRVYLK